MTRTVHIPTPEFQLAAQLLEMPSLFRVFSNIHPLEGECAMGRKSWRRTEAIRRYEFEIDDFAPISLICSFVSEWYFRSD